MGLISFEEVLGSAVVAALISFITAIVVARMTTRVTMKAAHFAAGEAREKEARAAIGRAIQSLQIAATEEAELRVRQESAGQARAALIELSAIPGFEIKSAEFGQILALLGTASEDDLQQAAELWTSVEGQIRAVVAPPEVAPGSWRKLLPGG